MVASVSVLTFGYESGIFCHLPLRKSRVRLSQVAFAQLKVVRTMVDVEKFCDFYENFY